MKIYVCMLTWHLVIMQMNVHGANTIQEVLVLKLIWPKGFHQVSLPVINFKGKKFSNYKNHNQNFNTNSLLITKIHVYMPTWHLVIMQMNVHGANTIQEVLALKLIWLKGFHLVSLPVINSIIHANKILI